jgi:peptide/nickel transport system permease protein
LIEAFSRIFKRLAWALGVVFAVTTLSFFLSHVLPGDPARMLVGPQASSQDVAHARDIYGLDQPITTRYLRFLYRLVHRGERSTELARKTKDHRSCVALGPVHVDLGFSFHYRRPVLDLLSTKLPRSLELAFGALSMELLLGLGLGITMAAKRGRRWDEIGSSLSLVGISAPTFLSGLALQYIFSHRLGWLPYDGYGKSSLDHLVCLVLPALTLGIYGSALQTRLVRAELGAALDRDYVRTARAKGASQLRALFVHGLRTALLPITTTAALDLGALVGGAIVTEKLFRWPGLGQMTVEAVVNRDGPLTSGVVLVASTAVVLSTLLVDLITPLLDPRTNR